MILSDCVKATLATLFKRTLWNKVLCPLFKSVLAAVGQIVTAELAILDPLIAVQEAILEDSVIMPLEIVKSAFGSLDTMSRQLDNLLAPTLCKDSAKASEALGNSKAAEANAIMRFLTRREANVKQLIADTELEREGLRYTEEFFETMGDSFTCQ